MPHEPYRDMKPDIRIYVLTIRHVSTDRFRADKITRSEAFPGRWYGTSTDNLTVLYIRTVHSFEDLYAWFCKHYPGSLISLAEVQLERIQGTEPFAHLLDKERRADA